MIQSISSPKLKKLSKLERIDLRENPCTASESHLEEFFPLLRSLKHLKELNARSVHEWNRIRDKAMFENAQSKASNLEGGDASLQDRYKQLRGTEQSLGRPNGSSFYCQFNVGSAT